MAASDNEVDRAFALAKQSGKPVFLYWGAVWCPPCNQVKATLFSRPDFVERSRAFIAVYVDGDRPGAQKVASRFKVQGYPTMIVFRADGTEITRLPGEVDPQRYLLTLTAGLDAQEPVRELARRAVLKQALTAEQWQLLAYYSWDTDEQQLFSDAELPQRLAELAAAAPADRPHERDRLALKALAASARVLSANRDGTASDSNYRLVSRILSDPVAVREQFDILIGNAESIIRYLAPAGEARRALATKWESALVQLLSGPPLSRSDHLDLLDSRVGIWKLIEGNGVLSAERRKQVLMDTSKIVAATADRYERQAVIPSAAHLLASSGLYMESDKLLQSELPRAVAPYYHLLMLASNAKKRGEPERALSLYEQAWKKSEGPATRIQWGTGYTIQVIELAPGDTARVETAASAVISQLEPRSETFFERNERSLKKMAKSLIAWQGADPTRTRVVAKVKLQLAKICKRLPSADRGRGNCEVVFQEQATS
ncbi:thioredoxin family protein [Caenimonas koreensis]|nr:thioredoxin family protein [Caenimonas koreensis]